MLKVHTVNRKFTQLMLGGHADANLYDDWTIPLQQIHDLTALIFSEVKPISILLADKEDKQKTVEQAIKVYNAKAFIKSHVSQIKILVESGRESKKETAELLAKAEQSLNVYKKEV